MSSENTNTSPQKNINDAGKDHSAKTPETKNLTDNTDLPEWSDQPTNEEISDDSATGAETVCPVCGLTNRPGELACARCGTILVTGGKTRTFVGGDESQGQANWPTGEVILTDQEPITLQIDGKEIVLPVAEVLTLGRSSDIPGEASPDIDLTPFGGSDKGVSRRHIRIKRKNVLIYIVDLGSTNGTLLNGRRLIPNAERLLRNGDELQLGRLKIKVKF